MENLKKFPNLVPLYGPEAARRAALRRRAMAPLALRNEAAREARRNAERRSA